MTDGKIREIITSIVIFAGKLLVFVVVSLVAIEFYLPSLQEMNAPIKRALANERNKLFLLGFIQNPAALYKVSEIDEKSGHMDSAKREMELALGLVEIQTSDKQVIKRYYDRLEALKRRAGG